MHTRYLITKNSNGDIEYSKSALYNGVPVGLTPVVRYNSVTISDSNLSPNNLEALSEEIIIGKSSISENPLCKEIMLNTSGECRPLSQMFGYKVTPDSEFANDLPLGLGFDILFYSDAVKDFLIDTALDMFKNDKDLLSYGDMLRFTPLPVLTGVITLQKDTTGVQLLNPNGVVTIAEFLDSLNAINYSCNSNRSRKKSIDFISDEKDYFNEGYNSCLVGISSPFYSLYRRSELLKPITRIELAYITVICWTKFIEKFNGVSGGNFDLGVCFDWENPAEFLKLFEDGFAYKVSKAVYDNEMPVLSLNVKDYKHSYSMTDFINRIKTGIQAVPFPMLMSMLELHQLELFYYGNRLDPLKEVSRLELCYFVTNLAKLFATNFKS